MSSFSAKYIFLIDLIFSNSVRLINKVSIIKIIQEISRGLRPYFFLRSSKVEIFFVLFFFYLRSLVLLWLYVSYVFSLAGTFDNQIFVLVFQIIWDKKYHSQTGADLGGHQGFDTLSNQKVSTVQFFSDINFHRPTQSFWLLDIVLVFIRKIHDFVTFLVDPIFFALVSARSLVLNIC